MNKVNYYAIPGTKKNGVFKPQQIIELVCEKTRVSWKKIVGPRGNKDVSNARHLMAYLLLKYTQLNKKDVAKMLNRDHSTICQTQITFKGYIDTDWQVKETVNKLERIIEY